MPDAKPFLDTNVVLYLLSADAAKADRAEELLAGGAIISVQVLNEFASVSVRKFRRTIPEIREALVAIRATCRVVALDEETHDIALDIAQRHQFTIYDALIVASALNAGCKKLLTEDLHHGQKIGGLRVQNPFLVS